MSWIVFALLAALFTAGAALLGKKTLFKEHAMEYSTVLALCNLLFSIPFFFFIDYSALALVPLLILFMISIIAAWAFVLVAKAIRHLDVSVSNPLLSIGPGLTAIAAFMFLGEQLSFIQSLGIILLVVGSYVLETKAHHSLTEPLKIFYKSKHIHYLLGGLLLYTVSSLLDRIVLFYYNLQVEAFTAFVHLFIALHMVLFLSFFHDGLKGIVHGVKTAGGIILAASLLTVAYRYSYAQAVSLMYVGLVASIRRLSALIVTVVGGGLFHEKNLGRRITACIIMVIGVALIVI